MKNITVLLGLIVSVSFLTGCASTCSKSAEPTVVHHDYKGEVSK